MKTIKNKKTQIKNVDDSYMNYSDLGKVCLNQMPQGGYDVTEMRDRLNLLSKLDKANGDIKLEDAEAKKLKEVVKSMKWTMMHEDLVNFIDEVEKC